MVIIRKKHKETAEEKEIRLQKDQEQAMGIQDQYQARGFELVSWVQEHKGLVISLIGLLVLCGALLSGYLYYQKRSAEIASSAYLEAIKPIEDREKIDQKDLEPVQKALTALTEVIQGHGSTSTASLARLYAGHLALELRDGKQAVERYKEASKDMDKSNALYPLALIGLGYAHEMSENKKEALETFESLIELKNNPSKDLALWETARIAADLKEDEKAKKNVARLLKEHPASVYERNALMLKETLK